MTPFLLLLITTAGAGTPAAGVPPAQPPPAPAPVNWIQTEADAWEKHVITNEVRLHGQWGSLPLSVLSEANEPHDVFEEDLVTPSAGSDSRATAVRLGVAGLVGAAARWVDPSAGPLPLHARSFKSSLSHTNFTVVGLEGAEQFLRQVTAAGPGEKPRLTSWRSPLSAHVRVLLREEHLEEEAGRGLQRMHAIWLVRAFGILGPLRRDSSGPPPDPGSDDGHYERMVSLLEEHDRIHTMAHFRSPWVAPATLSERAKSDSPDPLEDHLAILHPALGAPWDVFWGCGSAPPREQPRTLRLLSYNIWNVNEWPTADETGGLGSASASRRRHRREVIIDQIVSASADVIALQEVRFVNRVVDEPRGSLHQIDELIRGLRERGSGSDHSLIHYDFVYQGAHTDVALRMNPWGGAMLGTHEDEGVAIISKHPIIGSHSMSLSRNMSDPEDAHSRTVLHARIRLPVESGTAGSPVADGEGGFIVDVYTTHLGLSTSGRRRVVEEIEQFIERTNSAVLPVAGSPMVRPPVYLTGDFNAECHESSLQWLLRPESGLHDAQAAVSSRPLDLVEKPLCTNFYPEKSKRPTDTTGVLEIQDAWTFSALPNATHKVIDFVLYRPGSGQWHPVNGGPVENSATERAPSDHRALLFDFAQTPELAVSPKPCLGGNDRCGR